MNYAPNTYTQSRITGQHTLIVQPNLMAELTGTSVARIKGDLVELQYTDGTFESAKLNATERDGSWFLLVAFVQDRARVTAN